MMSSMLDVYKTPDRQKAAFVHAVETARTACLTQPVDWRGACVQRAMIAYAALTYLAGPEDMVLCQAGFIQSWSGEIDDRARPFDEWAPSTPSDFRAWVVIVAAANAKGMRSGGRPRSIDVDQRDLVVVDPSAHLLRGTPNEGPRPTGEVVWKSSRALAEDHYGYRTDDALTLKLFESFMGSLLPPDVLTASKDVILAFHQRGSD